MHISEGILTLPLLAGGGLLTAAGTAIGLKTIDPERIAHVGILSSAFFVASLIHITVGPASVHLTLNGLVGLLLGWAAVPAILVGLILQAVFFQFGGLTVLGINTLIMAGPAVLVHYLFRRAIWSPGFMGRAAAFACGFAAIVISSIGLAASLIWTESGFITTSGVILVSHLPVMVLEGLISLFCIGFLKKVKPELLPGMADHLQTGDC